MKILILSMLIAVSCQTQKIDDAKLNSEASSKLQKPTSPYEGYSFLFESNLPINGNQMTLYDYENIKNLSATFSAMVWQLENVKHSDLLHNLNALLDSNLKPDVLILEEWQEKSLPKNLHAKLAEHYGYKDVQQIGRKLKGGYLAVFATSKATHISKVDDGLRWTHPSQSDRKAWSFMKSYALENKLGLPNPGWTRNYYRYSFNKNGKTFHVVPVHLARFFGQKKGLKKGDPYGRHASDSSRYSIARLQSQKYSPLNNQLFHLRRQLSSDLAQKPGHVITLGNFNAPVETVKSIENASSQLSLLSQDTSITWWPERQQHTHAFVSGSDKKAVFAFSPKFLGSDHFPMFVLLKTGAKITTAEK